MDFLTDFETHREDILAVKEDEVKEPRTPVDEVTARGETLSVEAKKDARALNAAGLDTTKIETLNSLSGALRHCQANWMSEYRVKEEAQKEWQARYPLAYEMRDGMLHDLTFAYRKYSDLIKKVRRIREGNGHADMIQDLFELAVLAEKNPEPLQAINMDMELIVKAKAESHAMSELLANANGSSSASATKLLRDKAYTLLNECMSEIKEVGKYVFWKDEERLEKYMN